MNLLLLGPQGSGKGTQAAQIATDYGIPHISTGDMFRAAIASGSELGRRVEPILGAGDLVPDQLTIELIRDRLEQPDAQRGFVLDGFPRNLAQAQALDELLGSIGRELDAVLHFSVPDEVAMRRLLGRARAEGRSDDTPEVIGRRLAIYHEQTEPLAEYYRARDVLVPLDAERSVNEVYAQLQDALEQLEGRAA